jgi:hypothetical protein
VVWYQQNSESDGGRLGFGTSSSIPHYCLYTKRGIIDLLEVIATYRPVSKFK